MTKKICWLKWEDPFDPKEKDSNLEIQSQKDGFIENQDEESDRHLRVIVGPYGTIPINENSITGKLYKMWVGHCNFDITKDISNIIEKVAGVEILRVWTRYRFWIGVGNLFDDNVVHQEIESSIFPKKINESVSINALSKVLSKKYKFWVIYSLHNEEIKTLGGESKDAILNTIKEIKDILIISCSWEK